MYRRFGSPRPCRSFLVWHRIRRRPGAPTETGQGHADDHSAASVKVADAVD
jgi:hypothetical protein